MDNCIQVRCYLPFHYRFIYVDTDQHVSARIFGSSGIRIRKSKEMSGKGSPFRLIVCYIRKKDLNGFSEGLERLRNSILLLGYKGYDELCNELKQAEKLLKEGSTDSKLPICRIN